MARRRSADSPRLGRLSDLGPKRLSNMTFKLSRRVGGVVLEPMDASLLGWPVKQWSATEVALACVAINYRLGNKQQAATTRSLRFFSKQLTLDAVRTFSQTLNDQGRDVAALILKRIEGSK